MLRVIAGLAALAVGATVVLAQNTAAIKQRQDAMKALGAAAKEPSQMAKGEAKFDLAKVQASLKSIEATAIKGKTVFPDDSKGGDSAALPIAFTDKADLFAKFDKLAPPRPLRLPSRMKRA
jgi:cytochrome c556